MLDIACVDASFSINAIVAHKRSRIDDKCSMLWYRHLIHIFRKRIKRLVRDDVLSNLDFFDLFACVKRKLTAKVWKNTIDRCGDVLELVHTYVCGPFTSHALGGYRYFITLLKTSLVRDTLHSFMRSWIL